MRIAVLSDVHGNVQALEAVLADAAAQHVDAAVNLGDLLSGALQPRETAEQLLALEVADGVLAFHGSPTDDLTHLLETVEGPVQATASGSTQDVRRWAGTRTSWWSRLQELLPQVWLAGIAATARAGTGVILDDVFLDGSASQARVVHRGVTYDVEVDTTSSSSAQCARAVLAAITTP